MNEYSPYCDVADVRELIACAWSKNIPFYACRYPGEEQCRFGAQGSGMPVEGAVDGFRVVPFDTAGVDKAFTIQPDLFPKDIDKLRALPHRSVLQTTLVGDDADKPCYEQAAEALISAMHRGEASKVVLARTITRRCDMAGNLPDCFVRLCELYPTAYIFVVSYPGVCSWMGATPETLLLSSPQGYVTMALAGTRAAGTPGEWGMKERKEQQYVEQYISDILEAQGLQQVTVSRFTKPAAHVEHLCTLFDINTRHDATTRNTLVEALHPTPALAGVPTTIAKKLIRNVERLSRRYYGGYVGEALADGRCGLYVNLRSMELSAQAVRLYVGGGLTSQSVIADEWNETCAKAQTLLAALE